MKINWAQKIKKIGRAFGRTFGRAIWYPKLNNADQKICLYAFTRGRNLAPSTKIASAGCGKLDQDKRFQAFSFIRFAVLLRTLTKAESSAPNLFNFCAQFF